MPPNNHSLRVVLADDDPHTRSRFERLLKALGHQVLAVAENGAQLVEQCRATQPDLVITDVRMPDRDGIDAAAEVYHERPVPCILVSAYDEDELLRRAGAEHALAYLVKPVDPAQLKAAIHLALVRFEQLQVLTREVGSLRQALADRKLIDRAKGAIVRRVGVDEEEAFRRLRKLSTEENRKLADVARSVLAAEEVFRLFDRG